MCQSGLLRLISGAALAALLLPAALQAQSTAPVEAASPRSAQPLSQTGSFPPAPPEDSGPSLTNPLRLSDVEGSVRLFDTSGMPFDQARINMTVLPGMHIETGSNGRAELQFPDGSVARLTPNSSLSIATSSARAGPITLKPTIGLTYYEFTPEGAFTVQIGPVTARVTAAADPVSYTLLRVNLDATPYEAAVLHGAVHFEDAARNVTYDLTANETARIDPAAVNNYDIVQDLTNDTWDRWNMDRDSQLEELTAGSGGGHNADDAGWSDLGYYGQWYDVPGEGLAWAPDGVDQDFDPYGSGAWSYYTDAGYSWVSDYPWGWLPYHCGSWRYNNGPGWMWLPGGCGWGVNGGGGGGRWYPYPRTTGGPPRYHPPTRPPHSPTPRHPTASAPLMIAVHRGPDVHFRLPGGPRPVARSMQVDGQAVEPLVIAARPRYQGATDSPRNGGTSEGGGYPSYSNGFRSTRGGAMPGQTSNGSGTRMVNPPSAIHPPAEGSRYTPPTVTAPRPSAPAPAPSPAPRPSAPPAPPPSAPSSPHPR